MFGESLHVQRERAALDAIKKQIETGIVSVSAGDRVLLNAGLCGNGHAWERMEATVIEAGVTGHKVQYDGDDDTPRMKWVGNFAVCEVLKREKTPTTAHGQ